MIEGSRSFVHQGNRMSVRSELVHLLLILLAQLAAVESFVTLPSSHRSAVSIFFPAAKGSCTTQKLHQQAVGVGIPSTNCMEARASRIYTFHGGARVGRSRSTGSLRMAEGAGESETDTNMEVKIYTAIDKIDREEWNSCCEEAAGQGKENPFLCWEFLNALEASESASGASGWSPHHLVVHDKESGRILACAPVYLKGHSYGEYVFDHSWARAYRTFSSDNYYPKLQCCVPFTPVMGPRLMARGETAEEARQARMALVAGMVELCGKYQISSAHVTFPTKEDWELMGRQGFLLRTGIQYHWRNEGYQTFDEFLMKLKQSRRKSIRQERNKVAKAGVRVRALRGKEIEERHWDAFYQFYLNTVDEKWGQAYLNRKFFSLLGRDLAERVLLVVAEEEETGELVAGALNLIGGDCLYGRNWGCSKKYDSLHFELCYYQ
eukprot:761497-Hanusia_phi.AAC.1